MLEMIIDLIKGFVWNFGHIFVQRPYLDYEITWNDCVFCTVSAVIVTIGLVAFISVAIRTITETVKDLVNMRS